MGKLKRCRGVKGVGGQVLKCQLSNLNSMAAKRNLDIISYEQLAFQHLTSFSSLFPT